MISVLSKTASATRRWYVYLWIAGSAHFALVYALNTQPFLDLDLFFRGRERAPFQYRALTAWILGSLQDHVYLAAWLTARLPPRMSSGSVFSVAAIAFVSLLVAVAATERTLRSLFATVFRAKMQSSTASRFWALAVLGMAYFHYLLAFGRPCCEPLQYPYDLPGMAFFALGLWVIVLRRTFWLYPLLAVAMTNRESALLLVAMYLLFEVGVRRTEGASLVPALVHAALLAGVCLVVLHRMHLLYPNAQQRGMTSIGPFENHITDNVHLLLRPYYWLSYMSMFAFSWPYVYSRWKQVPHPGVRWALATGPLLLTATWIVGVLSEIRIFGELIPLMTVALALLFNAGRVFAAEPSSGSVHSNRLRI